MSYISNPNLKTTSYTPPQGRLPTEAELVGVRTKLPAGNPWRDTDHGYIFSQEEMDDIFPSKKSHTSTVQKQAIYTPDLSTFPQSRRVDASSIMDGSGTKSQNYDGPSISNVDPNNQNRNTKGMNPSNAWEYDPRWDNLRDFVNTNEKNMDKFLNKVPILDWKIKKPQMIQDGDNIHKDPSLWNIGKLGWDTYQNYQDFVLKK